MLTGERSPIQGEKVTTGIWLGLIGAVCWATVVIAYQVNQTTPVQETVSDSVIFTIVFIPVPVAVLMLGLRRTRQVGAGLVMGMAIGVLALTGLAVVAGVVLALGA